MHYIGSNIGFSGQAVPITDKSDIVKNSTNISVDPIIGTSLKMIKYYSAKHKNTPNESGL